MRYVSKEKIQIVNKVNKAWSFVAPKVGEVINSLIGKKLIKADGNKSKAFADALSPVLDKLRVELGLDRLYVSTRSNNVYLIAYGTQPKDGPGIESYEAERSIARYNDDGTIPEVDLSLYPTLEHNFTLAGFNEGQKRISELEKEIRKIQSTYYFA